MQQYIIQMCFEMTNPFTSSEKAPCPQDHHKIPEVTFVDSVWFLFVTSAEIACCCLRQDKRHRKEICRDLICCFLSLVPLWKSISASKYLFSQFFFLLESFLVCYDKVEAQISGLLLTSSLHYPNSSQFYFLGSNVGEYQICLHLFKPLDYPNRTIKYKIRMHYMSQHWQL